MRMISVASGVKNKHFINMEACRCFFQMLAL